MRSILAAVFTLVLFISVCRAAVPIDIAVSISPIADIVQRIGGDDVKVHTMLPPGASPHTYEPKPKDMTLYQNVRLFVMVGEGLDFWVEKIARASGNKPQIIAITTGLELIKLQGHGHVHDGGTYRWEKDPHVWLDPVLMLDITDEIEQKLSALFPAKSALFKQNAKRLKEELRRLDTDISKTLTSVSSRNMITFHNAWSYLAKRYGLHIIEILVDMPGKEVSPKKIRAIIDAGRTSKVKTIFVEPQFNPKAAEVIAQESGMKVITLDPIGGVPGRNSYLELMRYNLGQLVTGLQ